MNKKILSIILILCMILPFLLTAYADDAVLPEDEVQSTEKLTIEDAPYYRAVTVLKVLDIMQGKSDTWFGAEDLLTRAEMCAIVTRFLGLDSGVTQGERIIFNDVDASHWAKSYIDIAAALGIVNGNGDGNFEPEGNVTAEQAIKVMVCALGYEPKAQTTGGYPGGYITTANGLDMLLGIDFSEGYDKSIDRHKISMLVYNALEVELMEIKNYGVNQYSSVSKDKTALEAYHGVEKHTGVITSTYEAALTDVIPDVGEVIVNGIKYVTALDMSDYIGYTADIYCYTETERNEDEIITFFPDMTSSKPTEINFDDVEAVNVFNNFDIDITYYNKNTTKKKTVTLSKPVIVYNGKKESFVTNEEAQLFIDGNRNQGSFTVLENRDYGDILVIKNYDAYVVAVSDSKNKYISYNVYSVGKTDTQNIDLSEKDRVFIYDEAGKRINLDDLYKDDVIMIYASSDKDIYKIYRSRKQVTGNVDAMSVLPGGKDTYVPPLPPEPEPEPQPYWETISLFNMEDLVQDAKDKFLRTKIVNGRTVHVYGDFAGGPIKDCISGKLSEQSWDSNLNDITVNKPSIVGDGFFYVRRNWVTGGFPKPSSGIRVKNIMDSTLLQSGDKVKVTAWVYTTGGLFTNFNYGKFSTQEAPADAPQEVTLRMWLSQAADASLGHTDHNPSAPNAKYPDEVFHNRIAYKKWVPVSFEYTVSSTNIAAQCIRIDNCEMTEEGSEGQYPLRLLLGALQVERYVDPNAGKEDEIEIIPRPEIHTDATKYEVTIDGVEYEAVTNFPSGLLELGTSTTVFLDLNGKIAGYIPGLSKSGYGLLMDVAVADNAFEDKLLVKILDVDNTLNVYETLEEVKAYDSKKAAVIKRPAIDLVTDQPIDLLTTDYLWSTNNATNFQCIPRSWLTEENKSKAASRKIVYYRTNSEGKIHTILVPSIPEDDPDCKITMIKNFEYIEGNVDPGVLYHSYYPKFIAHSILAGRLDPVYRYGDGIPKFCAWSEDYEEDDYKVTTNEIWVDNVIFNRSWNYAQLYRKPGSKTVDFIVANPDHVAMDQSYTFITDYISETEEGYVFHGYNPVLTTNSNNRVTYKLKEDLRLFENLWMTSNKEGAERLTWDNIVDNVGILPYNVSYESEAMGYKKTPFVSPSTIESGDVVRVIVENNVITYLEVIRRKSVALPSMYGTIGKCNSAGFLNKDTGYAHGEIVGINHDAGTVKIRGYYWPSTSQMISASPTLYTQADSAVEEWSGKNNYISELEIDYYSYVNTTYFDEETNEYQVATFVDYEIGDLIFIVGQIDYPKVAIIFKNHNK